MEVVLEPEDKLVRFRPGQVEDVRKEYNIDLNAINIIEEWIKQQEHFVKKDFRQGYIERCIITCKGSLENTKKQIDAMCTMRTLMSKYFQKTDLRDKEMSSFVSKFHCAFMPYPTKEYYRAIILKLKPDAVFKTSEFTLYLSFLTILGEYLKSYDYCQGNYLIVDIFDANVAEILSKVNLVELQQFVPVITVGYGCKIKGVYLVTASKFIDSFLKLVKPLFSDKIASRIHAVSSRKQLQGLVGDCLPEEYGGTEKPLEELHDNLIKSLTAEPILQYLKEMSQAATDESKRKVDKFNEKYMGMPGTFRTLSLD